MTRSGHSRGFWGYARFFSDWCHYSKLAGAEPIRLGDTYPRVRDRTAETPFDAHYLYLNSWALRRILAAPPPWHIDVGSDAIFVSLLSGILPVMFLDYRPLHVKLGGLKCLGGSILALPFADRSVSSLFCLHAAEHIGLGRYGDPLDPQGTLKAVPLLQCPPYSRPGGHLQLAS